MNMYRVERLCHSLQGSTKISIARIEKLYNNNNNNFPKENLGSPQVGGGGAYEMLYEQQQQ